MNRREQLQERYEDALFALLMEDVIEEEGEALLRECERLNADPNAEIPEELDRKCRKLIRDSFRREKVRSAGRFTAKAMKKAAAAAVIAALLMGIAYAAVPEFRVGVLNFILKLTETEQSTQMWFSTDEELKAGKTHAGYFDYTLPEIPDSFELVHSIESDSGCAFTYQDDDNLISILIDLNGEGGQANIDTEDAQEVTDIEVNGYKGLCILKNSFVHIAWGDTDHMAFFSVSSNCLEKEDVLAMAEKTKLL